MPKDLAALEPRYELVEAASRFFPGGRVTKDTLKHQIRKGRLRAEIIANRYFVTETDLLALCRACEHNGPAQPATPDIASDVPVASMADTWPRLMRAERAAAYLDEKSVEAFRRAVGTLGTLYPPPIKVPGKGERWLKEALDHAIDKLRNRSQAVRDIADQL